MRSVILQNVGTLILYNETHQYLEDLHNSVKHYFPNDSCAMPQEHMWVKGWFKVQEKPMALTVKIEKFIDDVSDSTLTNLKKLPLWVEYPQLSEKTNYSSLFLLHMCVRVPFLYILH